MNNEIPTHFHTKASQKDALDKLSKLYERIERKLHNKLLKMRPEDERPESHQQISAHKKDEWVARFGDLPKDVRYVGSFICFPLEGEYKAWTEMYYGVPSYLHQVREKHSKIWDYAGEDFNEVRGLIVARDHIKSCPIVKKPKVEKTEGKRTKNSATHRGVCQICGKVHKVNVHTGLLAEHGYTLDFGYFSGSCIGSNQLPINVSCDFLIETRNKAEGDLQIMENNPEDVHHVSKQERYNRETGSYQTVSVPVLNKQVAPQVRSMVSSWNNIIENWKATELTPIKYDN